jgi:hypothetical protein
MSLQSCPPGSTVGFPIKLNQNLFAEWPGASTDLATALKPVIQENELSVSWGPVQKGAQIVASVGPSSFTVSGFNVAADATTLSLGTANYRCSEVISVAKIQHASFCTDKNALYEFIQAFQIQNKGSNPSSPDIILLTRPLVFNDTENAFWSAIDTSALKKGESQRVDIDLKSLYAYSTGDLLPTVSYRTCLPVQLLNYNGETAKGSIKIQVNVVMAPIYVKASSSGLDTCRNVSAYSLITTPKRPADCFPDATSSTIFQFSIGLNKYPSDSKNNFRCLAPNSTLADLATTTQKLMIEVPKPFLDKPISKISSAIAPPLQSTVEGFTGSGPTKNYKCYRIDPTRDVKDGQILVDPTTGEPLSKVMDEENEGQDPAITAALNGKAPQPSGLLPGDIEFILSIIATVIGSIVLLAYGGYVVNILFIRKDLNSGLFHLVFFVLALLSLSVFAIFFDKK